MGASLFFAELFGFYFLFIGVVFIWRRKTLLPVFEEFATSKALMMATALLEIFAGITVVAIHNIWTFDFRVITTIIGYWLIIEGMIYIILPKKKILKNIVKIFGKPKWYISGSLLSIFIGIYLLHAVFTY